MFNVLAFFAFLSSFLTMWQWVVAWCFPLHRRSVNTRTAPAVTLLKPLKGRDENTADCIRSWLAQDYWGETQVLFGVASADDPVCELLSGLIAEYPAVNARLIICREALGTNGKVSSLIQLLRQAEHDVIVVSDADVFVPRDFLANVVAPLRDRSVGLVNCFYRLANPTNLPTRWEAIATNADFWSQVLQGQSIAPLDFALGAVMATRREELAKIGGFEALADHLADDFQLGNRVVRFAGKSIEVCPVVADCRSAPMSWQEAWTHQLRWARTIRVCKPLPYALSIVSNATFWPLFWVIIQPEDASLWTLAVCLCIRIATALSLQNRLGRVAGQWWYWWLPPVKDLLQCALWVAAFFGNDIVWRGQRFRLQRDGRLVASGSKFGVEEASGATIQSATD